MTKKHDYQYVKKYIEDFNYKLLSKKYINGHEYLNIECDNGHKYKATWNKFQQGKRCKICSRKKASEKQRFSYRYVKKYIEDFNYKLLSKKYINIHNILSFQCDKGHVYKTTFNSFKRGNRCAICAGLKITIDDVKYQIESVKGYKLLDKIYKNCDTKLKIQCPKGHEYKVTWDNFKQGNRCPICNYNNLSSKSEKEIQNFVSLYIKNCEFNNRNIIINPLTHHYLELDIYLPNLNKAIEYNGLYWHSFPKAIKYDKIKKEQCEKLGINLLIIKEENWLNNKNKELEKIKDFIND